MINEFKLFILTNIQFTYYKCINIKIQFNFKIEFIDNRDYISKFNS